MSITALVYSCRYLCPNSGPPRPHAALCLMVHARAIASCAKTRETPLLDGLKLAPLTFVVLLLTPTGRQTGTFCRTMAFFHTVQTTVSCRALRQAHPPC